MAEEEKRLQLVVDRPSSTRMPFIGFGLLASLVVGFGLLTEAASGAGSFEGAIGRFLLLAGACALGGSVLGRMIDNATSKQGLDSGRDRPMEASRQAEATNASPPGDTTDKENR